MHGSISHLVGYIHPSLFKFFSTLVSLLSFTILSQHAQVGSDLVIYSTPARSNESRQKTPSPVPFLFLFGFLLFNSYSERDRFARRSPHGVTAAGGLRRWMRQGYYCVFLKIRVTELY